MKLTASEIIILLIFATLALAAYFKVSSFSDDIEIIYKRLDAIELEIDMNH